MEDILKQLNINEEFTKRARKAKVFTKVKDNVPKEANYNFMADLLELPKTKTGYKYLLVMTDLATNAFDIEPMKNKTSETTLQSMKNMFKRKYIKQPYSSVQTDNGSEFMGTFNSFLKHHNIYHAKTLPDRHTQNSNVEALNKQLGRLFTGYMNAVEEETDKRYNEWDDVIDIVRNELNKYRKIPAKETADVDYGFPNVSHQPKFNVGDVVHRVLEIPYDALGYPQPTKIFRIGDYSWEKHPRKIKEILYYSGKVPYRYMLEGIKNASFTESQLKPSKQQHSKFVVKAIIGRKQVNYVIYYLVWFAKELKKNAQWIPKLQLIEDGFEDEIKQYERDKKKGIKS